MKVRQCFSCWARPSAVESAAAANRNGSADPADSKADPQGVAASKARHVHKAASPGAAAAASPDSKPVHPAVLAYRNGSLAFSFSGGGFLLPYFVGALQSLRGLGLVAADCHTGGSSAGSLVAASIAAGLTPEEIMDSYRATVRDVRAKGVNGRLSAALVEQLEAQMPVDAHTRVSGRVHLSITRVFPVLKSKVISHFSSRQDLISALLASCHIPLLSDGSLTTQFRDRTVVDGGVTLLIPTAPAATHYTVKISCLPRAHIKVLPFFNKALALQDLAFSPDEYAPWPMTVRELMAFALAPGPDEFITQLVDAGASDATRWATAVGLADEAAPAVAAAVAAAKHAASVPPTIPSSLGSSPGQTLPPGGGVGGGGGGGDAVTALLGEVLSRPSLDDPQVPVEDDTEGATEEAPSGKEGGAGSAAVGRGGAAEAPAAQKGGR